MTIEDMIDYIEALEATNDQLVKTMGAGLHS